ncbi:S ribonuclease [Pyrus ussuriensis x Pyrus communis]|uniref:S ribonuclease n=1 Tax=Pyrus ussuriensis x Pyrus communis TaxID=2448454 RepID=A0A5N5FEJ9_9ROSA|nr:S ribonuclease [Pyrus ussuriensis x Pyrus communis]
MLNVIATIHALGKAQKEIITYVKELKNLIPKPSEKTSDKDCTPKDKASHDRSTASAGKGPKKAPSLVT